MMLWPGASSRAVCAEAARPGCSAPARAAGTLPSPELPAVPLRVAAPRLDEEVPDAEVPAEQPASSRLPPQSTAVRVTAAARAPGLRASVRIVAFMLVGRTRQAAGSVPAIIGGKRQSAGKEYHDERAGGARRRSSRPRDRPGQRARARLQPGRRVRAGHGPLDRRAR